MSYLNDNLEYLAQRLRKYIRTFKKRKGWKQYKLRTLYYALDEDSVRKFITGIIKVTRGEQFLQRRVLLVVPAEYKDVIADVDFSTVFEKDIQIQEEMTQDDMPAYIFRLYIPEIGERTFGEI